MTFDELLVQVTEMLQRQGRVAYGALRRRFALEEACARQAPPLTVPPLSLVSCAGSGYTQESHFCPPRLSTPGSSLLRVRVTEWRQNKTR